jgi:maltooligosyltrehalose trehalohydrolase
VIDSDFASSSSSLRLWRPALGAIPGANGVSFRVWAPAARSVDLLLPGSEVASRAMARGERGFFSALVDDMRAGALYWYRVDGGDPLPDPASRFQPLGVHGPSAVVNPHDFVWTDGDWGWEPKPSSIYELHVGTFTAAGTFAGVESRLGELGTLGVDTIELMPLAEWAGRRNWGYDAVDLFAPSHRYGTPDDLRRLVNAAHAHRIAIILDVVYSHLGLDGAYISDFNPYYFNRIQQSPWGATVNLDGPHSDVVRDFFVENALHWLHEYHVDGFRLDATHQLRDRSPRHFLEEFVARVRAGATRPVFIAAEDNRHDATLILSPEDDGFGFDAVWADDLHHHLRRAVAGDTAGYFADFSGSAGDIAATIRQGWCSSEQMSMAGGKGLGGDSSAIRLEQFIICLQNHDQVGHRALGERLHHQISPAAYRALSALLLCAPQTPLLLMGQEWAASTPFLYFADHDVDFGRSVTEGRRAEFAQWRAFAAPEKIPDPQSEATFARSTLVWSERDAGLHQQTLLLYRTLLELRRTEPSLCGKVDPRSTAVAVDEDTIVMLRCAAEAPLISVIVRLREPGSITLPCCVAAAAGGEGFRVILTTEDTAFTETGRPPNIRSQPGEPTAIEFDGPAAVILRGPLVASRSH